MHSYCHHKEGETKELQRSASKIQGSDNRLMLFGAMALVVILGGVGWGLWGGKSDNVTTISSGTPNIILEPQKFDAGDVSMASGKYVTFVTVKNIGNSTLKISGIQTSCMCTVASLEVNGKTSPEFGMPGHGRMPFWSGAEIAAGESGKLKIIFDPLAHGPEATGFVKRAVYLRTNDPDTPEAVISFTANVVK